MGVKLFIWSSLAPVNKISKGRLSVGGFDGKAEITEYLKASGVPYALVPAGGYLTNFLAGPLAPKKQDDGTYVLSLPIPGSTVRPIIDIEHDYGMYAYMYEQQSRTRPLGAGSEVLTGTLASYDEFLAQLSERKWQLE